MVRKVYLAPSLLSADFGHLADAVRRVSQAGVRYVHLDVMDGRFVPQITFGPKMVADLRDAAEGLQMIAHLMVVHPEQHIKAFAAAGADVITVHAEATPHLHRALQYVKAEGIKAGVALNPGTPLAAAEEVLDVADFILIMSVNPGYGGQRFIDASLSKIERARRLADTVSDRDLLIEVDGGINKGNIQEVAAAGADVIVAGQAVFGESDAARAVAELTALI